MKKGRHRRYEEARALKRGPDLDIEALFTDLEGEPIVQSAVVEQDLDDDIEVDPGVDAGEDQVQEEDLYDADSSDPESSSELD